VAEQRAVFRFLALKQLSSKEILTELQEIHQGEVLTWCAIEKWRQSFLNERTNMFDDSRPGRSSSNDLADVISRLIAERPFVSCKVLYMKLWIGKQTCARILHDILGMIKFIYAGFHIHWPSIKRPKNLYFSWLTNNIRRITKGWFCLFINRRQVMIYPQIFAWCNMDIIDR
jgi:hypothetical protein